MKKYREIIAGLPVEGFLKPLSNDESNILKGILLNAIIEIDEVCRKHNVKVFLVGGTLLGAVRHKGFIPWDDDVDLGITRSDFEKLKVFFDAEFGSKYILNAPNYSTNPIGRFPKVLIKGTKEESLELVDDSRALICVDLFILENIPHNYFLRKLKGSIAEIYMAISSFVCSYQRKNIHLDRFISQDPAAKKEYQKRLIIGHFFSFKRQNKWLDAVDKKCRYHKETNFVGIPTGRKHYFGEIIPSSAIFPFKEIEFEGHSFYCPNDCDKYLSNLYGNYMQIPPIENREQHFVYSIDFGIKNRNST